MPLIMKKTPNKSMLANNAVNQSLKAKPMMAVGIVAMIINNNNLVFSSHFKLKADFIMANMSFQNTMTMTNNVAR